MPPSSRDPPRHHRQASVVPTFGAWGDQFVKSSTQESDDDAKPPGSLCSGNLSPCAAAFFVTGSLFKII